MANLIAVLQQLLVADNEAIAEATKELQVMTRNSPTGLVAELSEVKQGAHGPFIPSPFALLIDSLLPS